MAEFATRVELREAFYQMVGSVSTDAALVVNGEDVDQIANRCLQLGAWNAQRYMIGLGAGEMWYQVSALLVWTDTAFNGQVVKVVSAGSDVLRAAGDEDHSCIRRADGTGWGREIDPRDRFTAEGDYFYFIDQSGVPYIHTTPSASVPSDAYLHYYQRATLSDATNPPFREQDRGLIVAEAALIAMDQSWFTGDAQQRVAIEHQREYWRQAVRDSTRTTRRPKRMRTRRGMGSHFWT